MYPCSTVQIFLPPSPLSVDVALLQVCVIIVKVPVPVVSVLWYRDFQPGFEFPAVVDDRCTLKIISSNARMMAKP